MYENTKFTINESCLKKILQQKLESHPFFLIVNKSGSFQLKIFE